MTFDQMIRLASDIIAEGRRLDAIRFLRRTGMHFRTAKQYAEEIEAKDPWMTAAAKRGKFTISRK